MTRLHSLLLVEEKLLEAQYFAFRLKSLATDHFQYEFNAGRQYLHGRDDDSQRRRPRFVDISICRTRVSRARRASPP